MINVLDKLQASYYFPVANIVEFQFQLQIEILFSVKCFQSWFFQQIKYSLFSASAQTTNTFIHIHLSLCYRVFSLTSILFRDNSVTEQTRTYCRLLVNSFPVGGKLNQTNGPPFSS